MKSSSKESRIKKLGQIKVWPSVLAVIITCFVVIGAVYGTTLILCTIVADDVLAVDYDDADKILRTVCDSIQNNGKVNEAQTERLIYGKDIHYLQVFDYDKEIVYEYGNVNQNRKRNIINLNLDDNKNLYVVLGKEIVDSEKELVKVFKELDYKSKNEEIVFSTPVLIQYKIKGGYSVQIKTDIVLSRRIVTYYSILNMLLIFITVLPLCFLLGNVLKNTSVNIKMQKLLFTDIQTGASNWICFEQTVMDIISKARYRRKEFAIVDIEIVGYSNLLAFFGSNEGISLLERYNKYLVSKVSSHNEMVSHIPKSNFVLLLSGDEDQDFKRKVEILLQGFSFEKKCHYLGFHAGIFNLPSGKTKKGLLERRKLSIADCYNNAVMARHSISDFEGNKVIEFNNTLLDEQIWEHKVEERIDEAISKREFKVYFQPKYDPVYEKLVGAEALIRWVSESEGFVSPANFIPIYERNGLIKKIDDYMLDMVARYQAKWIQIGRKIVPVSVNVSRAHFADENLAEHIRDIVDRYKVPHKFIEIELTESAFFDDKDTILKIVEKIQEYGFEVSMDDFGTGYSSLNSLKDLDLDVLKLDAEFFRGSMEEERTKIVISDAIKMAKHLGMRVVAEGIEKKEQVQFLANAGCDMIQGFYYSKPIPAAEYTQKMEKIKQ